MRLEDPSDLPRQNRRQRYFQLDDFLEIGPAAPRVAITERLRDPVGIVGEQVGKVTEIRHRPQQLRERAHLPVGQPVDFIDQDEDVCPAVLQLAGECCAHMAQGGAAGEALPQRVETGCSGAAVAEPDVFGRCYALAVLEDRLRQALQLAGWGQPGRSRLVSIAAVNSAKKAWIKPLRESASHGLKVTTMVAGWRASARSATRLRIEDLPLPLGPVRPSTTPVARPSGSISASRSRATKS